MNIIEKIDKRFAINSNYNETFDKFAIACYDLHYHVNQKYDNNPYSLHLRMVTNMLPIVFNDAWECGFIINNMYEQTLLKDYIKCFYSALLHDSIEDARLTYNDVKKMVSSYNSFCFSCYDDEEMRTFHYMLMIEPEDVADIVYAVTNEKGKNRSERANEKYYQGIRENKLAVIVKICDRLANALYSKLINSRMLDVYKKEHEHFIDSVIEDDNSEFYKTDVWGEYNKLISPYIEKGMSLYGEIVGYVSGSQKMIQKSYDYGCMEGENYLMIYRITTKDKDGVKKEWNVTDVEKWAKNLLKKHPELKKNVHPIKILYHGTLADLYPEISTTDHWHENILEAMKADKMHFGMEEDEPYCKNKVPREGIVIRIDNDKKPEAFKLKCLKFYQRERKMIDKGEVDIEMVQGYTEEN